MLLFENRFDAGLKLAEQLQIPDNAVLFAVPRGGVPVAYAVAVEKELPLDLVVVKKLPAPWNPEAGFGAMAPDGTVFWADTLGGRVSMDTVVEVGRKVLEEVKRRERVYRGSSRYPDLFGRLAVVIDDGFASGYTAARGASFLRWLQPERIWCVAPVCSEKALKVLREFCDRVFCLHVSRELPFAVASFYADFHDLTDEEVLAYLQDLRRRGLLLTEES